MSFFPKSSSRRPTPTQKRRDARFFEKDASLPARFSRSRPYVWCVSLCFLFGFGGVVFVRVFYLSLRDGVVVSRPPTKKREDSLYVRTPPFSLTARVIIYLSRFENDATLLLLRRRKEEERRVESADRKRARIYNQLIGFMSLLLMMSVVS